TPTEKAIKDLIDEVRKQGQASIDGVIVHPSDLPTLGALLTNKPLPTGGPLMRAHERLTAGRPKPTTFIPPERVQTAVQASALEQQLIDSLWALQQGT